MEQFLKFLEGLVPMLWFICGVISAITAIATGDFVTVCGVIFLIPFVWGYIKHMIKAENEEE